MSTQRRIIMLSFFQVAAGNLRQQLGEDPRWTEARLVLRSVNDINLPKFTVEDLPLFRGITSDLFPGVELGESDHGPLLQNIDTVCEEGITISPGHSLKLMPKLSWRKKVIQLYEMVLVRHGVMIVGQTGSGKTTTVHTLANAMTRCCEDGSAHFARVQVCLAVLIKVLGVIYEVFCYPIIFQKYEAIFLTAIWRFALRCSP